jgi:hypothetical protein
VVVLHLNPLFALVARLAERFLNLTTMRLLSMSVTIQMKIAICKRNENNNFN